MEITTDRKEMAMIKLKELVTRTYELDELNEGYDDLLNGRIMRGLILF